MYVLMHSREAAMRTTFNIDDELLREAQRLTGMTERTALIHEGLRALIERESARRLARLGSTERSLRVPSRRRSSRGAKGT
jgi:Arc/MetJ family transcription regulator